MVGGATLLVFVSANAVVACCGASQAPRPFSGRAVAFHEGARLVVAGDFQRTAPLLEFWREQNDAERARIVRAIADVHPDLLAITGDCVFNGGSDAQWSAFEALVQPLRDQGVVAIGAFGNHEYWEGLDEAEAHLFPRFPLDARRHWFGIAFGPLRLVVLDSNDDRLEPAQWRAQVEWYQRTLDAYDDDPAARGVLVLLHQPPYTNSTVTGDGLLVQRDFVPPLLRHHKTLGMLSGHVHSYERFERGGKTFLVSGGGGGPRAELATGSKRRHPDDRFDGPVLRDFNFAVYTPNSQGVEVAVMGLPKGAPEARVMDRFLMTWPQ